MMIDPESGTKLANFLHTTRIFHECSGAENDPRVKAHIEDLREWEEMVRDCVESTQAELVPAKADQ